MVYKSCNLCFAEQTYGIEPGAWAGSLRDRWKRKCVVGDTKLDLGCWHETEGVGERNKAIHRSMPSPPPSQLHRTYQNGVVRKAAFNVTKSNLETLKN